MQTAFGISEMETERRGRKNDLFLPSGPSCHDPITHIERANLDAEETNDGPRPIDEHGKTKSSEKHTQRKRKR